MDRFILQNSSTRPNGWVLTDTQSKIVVQFDDGDYNGTQRVTMLDDAPYPSANELARIMKEIGEYATRHHGSKCFAQPYGFEYSEDDTRLYLYRRKSPRWRLEIEDKTDAAHLASTLRKAAEFLVKKIGYDKDIHNG